MPGAPLPASRNSCKKIEIVASSIIFLRKDARIGGFSKQNAKRATLANNLAGLLQGVAPVALTDLRRSFRKTEH